MRNSIAADQISFLPIPRALLFDGGEINPVPDYSTSAAIVAKATREDGFIYPGQTVRQRPTTDNSGQPISWHSIPGSTKPAFLFRLPASHELRGEHSSPSDFRRNAGGFLLHAIGFVFGVRLQFQDWWFDGRTKISRSSDFSATDDAAARFLSSAYNAWKSWKTTSKQRITNALYMHLRTPAHRWDWERFTISYMVFDALFRVAKEESRINPTEKRIRHSERIAAACTSFGIQMNNPAFDEIARLRNDLFHEALWDGSAPGCATPKRRLEQHLRSINSRIVVSLLGARSSYIASDWSTSSVKTL